MPPEVISITLPDSSTKSMPAGSTVAELAKAIGPRLAKDALAAVVDGKSVDLSFVLQKSCTLRILTWKNPEGVEVFRHSSAHLLAQAVLRLFPEAKPTIGPVVEEGFYYDFEHPPFTPEDLAAIEAEMRKIVEADYPVQRLELDRQKALRLFKNNPYKIEIINETPPEEVISAYQQGEFTDLCRGPHLPRTGMIRALKLTKLAGAYWKGDPKNPMLQRIYGITFPTEQELKDYLFVQEEAARRDHRKLGKELDLFSFSDLAPGMPFWHPKGWILYCELINFMREEYRKRGYQEIRTPQMSSKKLWVTSGHWEHYHDNMYVFAMKGEKEEIGIKPMNCPASTIIYKSTIRSYRDLPLRLADFGILHRYELGGVIHGLMRVREFVQDDAHIYATPDQLQEEVAGLLQFVAAVYRVFGFSYDVKLSTRPEKFMGEPALWDKAELSLAEALKKNNIACQVNEGEGAFYGPKIDFDIKDCLGRKWQCATIQLDFQLPLCFGLHYEAEDGRRYPPVIIHRTIFGSLERFIGILIEHFAGKLPVWLSPAQVILLTIADRHAEYAETVAQKLFEQRIRVEKDTRPESIPKKVREAQLRKIPYILVAGDREVRNKTVTVRTRDNVVHGEWSVEQFLESLRKDVEEKRLW